VTVSYPVFFNGRAGGTPITAEELAIIGAYIDQQDASHAGTPGAPGGFPAVTKRVTLPIGATGYGAAAGNYSPATVDILQRTLIKLPATTTRWRLRVRNYPFAAGPPITGAVTFSNVYAGTPQFPSAGGAWAGTFTSAPTSVLSGFSTPTDGAETISAWVTAAGSQFQAGTIYGLSWGLTGAGGQAFSQDYGNCLAWNGTGSSAAAGNAATPGTSALGPLALLDVRIEAEAVTPTPVGLFIGDSITWGANPTGSGATSFAFPYQAFPVAAGLQQGFLAINLGVPGLFTTNALTFSSYIYRRADLVTTVPDFAVVMFGTNDIANGVSLATWEQNMATIIAAIRKIGISRVYAATVTPRSYTAGSQETERTGMNAFLRTLPNGIDGLFDFDKATALQATPNNPDADLIPSSPSLNPHPSLAGYAKLAQTVQAPSGMVPATAATLSQFDAAAVALDGIMGYWPLSEASGTTINDLTRVTNGTITGGVTLAQTGNLTGGQTAALFDGSTGFITVPTGPNLELEGDLTLFAWVHPTDRANYYYIASKSGAFPYALRLETTSAQSMFLSGGNSQGGTTPPTAAAWSFMCVTRSGTTITHYLNGSTNGSGTVAASTDGGNPLLIGKDTGGFPFKGLMQGIGLVRGALTGTQITALYNAR
jgi:lysophospholipase L1-like esterase